MPGSNKNVSIELHNINHQFSSDNGIVDVVRNASFSLNEGEIVALVGPSGCGKTTLLNMIAGIIKPTSGSVIRFADEVQGTDTRVGYMFARPALLPWRTALQNIALGMEFRRVNGKQRHATAEELLHLVGLDGFGTSYPSQLSQGMRQRVALARTLATDPEILLMDEPFGALDAQTKLLMQIEFMRLWKSNRKTVVWVTHDLNEAVALADRVMVCSRRPCQIKSIINVALDRDRDIAQMQYEDQYLKLCGEVWEALREEFTYADSRP